MRSQLKTEIYKRGETLTSFAEKIGSSRFTLMAIIKGKYKKVSGPLICMIAKGLGMSYEETEEMLNASN